MDLEDEHWQVDNNNGEFDMNSNDESEGERADKLDDNWASIFFSTMYIDTI